MYTLKPSEGRSDWHFIYTHGGVCVEALISPHWSIIEQLILQTGATVTAPSTHWRQNTPTARRSRS